MTPCCFVDDLSAEMTGPDDHVVTELGGFIAVIAEEFQTCELELSSTKCVSSASNASLGTRLQNHWRELGLNVPYCEGVKSLGAGLGAGVRRNVQVIRARLKSFAARVPRF